MTLDPRARTKISAALSLIALHGYNPRPVQEHANQRIAAGQAPNLAYSFALNTFADKVPGIRPMMEIALDLIQNSDDATLAVYDDAIAAYNATGDTAKIDALAPMVLDDARALAVRNGEVSAEEAASWDIDAALGFNEDAFAEVPDVPDAASPIPPSEFQQPEPATVSKDALGNPSQFLPQQAQQGPTGWSAMGYSPARARAAQQASGRPQTQAEYKARQWADTPVGAGSHIRTAGGYRAAPTGVKARQEAGVPLGNGA